MRCGCVSARQIFSGGKGNSRSTTTVRVSVDGSFIVRHGQDSRAKSVDVALKLEAPLLKARLPARQLRDLNEVAAGVVQLGDGRTGHRGRRHGELGAARFDALAVAVDVVGEEHSSQAAPAGTDACW